MPSLFFIVGFFQLYKVALAYVPSVGVMEVGAKQVQVERVAFHIFDEWFKLALSSLYAKFLEQRNAGFLGQTREFVFRGGGLPIGSQVRNRISGSHDA